MKFSVRKKEFPVTEKYSVTVNISCHRKHFPVTIRNFLSQEKFSCNGKKFFTNNIFLVTQSIFFPVKQYVLPVRGFAPPLAISIPLFCTNNIFPVTRTFFLVRENSFLMKFGLSQVYYIFTTNVRDSQSNFRLRP